MSRSRILGSYDGATGIMGRIRSSAANGGGSSSLKMLAGDDAVCGKALLLSQMSDHRSV